MELFNNTPKKYGEEYHNHLLEQWKTCIEMADNISERRVTTNNIFITLNSLILGLSAFMGKEREVIISIIGLFISILWILTIHNYKKLNSHKFHIINEIEKKLPASPFAYEWAIVKKSKLKKKYIRMTDIEKLIPIIFMIIYSGILFFNVIITGGK